MAVCIVHGIGWFWIGLLVVCVFVTLTGAECHCNTTTACDMFPSTPCSQVGDSDRCQEGWFGSYCQKQNVALRRSCNQSSTFLNDAGLYGAGVGVDGIVTTDVTREPCAHTKNESNPTWTVKLNTSVPEKIQHIRLYIREMLQERSNGMEILVGSQMCYNWSSTEHPPPIADVTCRQPLTGTTVTIRIPGPLKYLTLCEVQIFVCSNGWFSEDCDKQCRCHNSTDECDKITGHCSSGCFPGYHGTDCQAACQDGKFGDNCASKCGNCLSGVICNKTTGACPGGCAAGWVSDDSCMEACPDGSYGISCTYDCGNCLGADICDKTNGACHLGCAAGWRSDTTCLQACPNGSYGINCASQCGKCLDGVSCDKRNGACPGGCAAGWINDGTCLQRCPAGTHGINCTADCGCGDFKARDTYSELGSNWGIPVAAILGVLLICTVTGGTIYIRRLLKQLESLKTKVREEHYMTLDERTTATDSAYEPIGNVTPYYNTVDHLQDETG